MGILDWLIVLVPVAAIMYVAWHCRSYIRSVADFLSAGRIAGRYVLNVGDIANALSILGLVAYVEVQYKTGFALTFWNKLMLPLSVIMGLTGYCTYRFRETKAMSLGQFLEMRYSRRFRIFASALRSFAECMTNMIMPAIAARFFIYFLDLPRFVNIFGFQLPTFILLTIICLTLAISIICMGGCIAMIVTDALQGMLLYPLMVVFVIFVICKFSWNNEIVPVMFDRVADESFLNPYDIENLRDFNVFFLVLGFFTSILQHASWIGHATSGASRTPHEGKMGGLLGSWRNALNSIFYVLIAVMILTLLNHRNYAEQARDVRVDLCGKVATELTDTPAAHEKLMQSIRAIPVKPHQIGVDAPLSDKRNLDTVYLETAHQALLEQNENKAEANSKFQQFRTLYYQLNLAATMRSLLPSGMLGLFCLLLVMAMISTDDTRIYSAALTIAQDVVIPLTGKRDLTMKQHVTIIRMVCIGIGVWFFFGSLLMAQMDYVNLYSTIICSMWHGGCGPVMICGLYSRFGTTAAAWTSLLSGMGLAFFQIFCTRNWASIVYPWLERHGWTGSVGNFLRTCSGPFEPYIHWEMNPVKCPVNAYEFYFATMIITLILYLVVSYFTCKKPFNLERMLHRGIYNLDGEDKRREPWTLHNVFNKLIGITPEYTLGDKFIAWFFFCYSFMYEFFLSFICIIIWNWVSPWPLEWWGHYFLITALVVPAVMSFISTFWFGIGGVIDLRRMFRDLKNREVNDLDNGMVEGNVSLADRARFAEAEKTVEDEK